MTRSPAASDPAFLSRHLEALEAAAGALGTGRGAEAAVRRIAGTLERAMVRQGLGEVAVVARRTAKAEGSVLGAEAGRLIDLLRAIRNGTIRPLSTVLIVDRETDASAELARALARAGWNPVSVESGAEVLAVFRQQVVDAVVLCLELPDIDGREILTAFRNQPYTATLPVVVLTASQEPWVEAECLALGASRFFTKPVAPGAVLEGLDQLARASKAVASGGADVAVPDSAAGPPASAAALALAAPRGQESPLTDQPASPVRVLLAEQDPLTAKIIAQRLGREGLQVQHFTSGSDALEAAQGLVPGIVVIDTLISGVEGLDLVARLRAMPAYRTVPIIVLSAIGGEREVVRAFEAGADECLRKPFSPAELVARIDRLLKRRDR